MIISQGRNALLVLIGILFGGLLFGSPPIEPALSASYGAKTGVAGAGPELPIPMQPCTSSPCQEEFPRAVVLPTPAPTPTIRGLPSNMNASSGGYLSLETVTYPSGVTKKTNGRTVPGKAVPVDILELAITLWPNDTKRNMETLYIPYGQYTISVCQYHKDTACKKTVH